jgi:transposase
MPRAITLSDAERMELTRRANSRTGREGIARRARLILLLAEGYTWDETSERIVCSRGFVASWSKRFAEQGIAGLYCRHLGQVATVLSPVLEARILSATRHVPGGAIRWTTRKLASHLQVSHMMVARVWRKHGLSPHPIEPAGAADEPNFVDMAADIVGLYLKPPVHAAVFCVGEKAAPGTLNREDPALPFWAATAKQRGFENFCQGTLALHAAVNAGTGEVLGNTLERHSSAAFVAFLTDIVINEARGHAIHVIATNPPAPMSGLVNDFLIAHPKVRLHLRPTYSSWLSQIELWIGEIERDILARGVVAADSDLESMIMRYLRYHKTPRAVKWKYGDPSRRASAESPDPGSSVT